MAALLLAGCNSWSRLPDPDPSHHAEKDAVDIIDNEVKAPEVIMVRAVVVSYKGAEGASRSLERTEEEAKTRAATISQLARQPSSVFRQLTTKYSDGPQSELRVRAGNGVLPPEVDAAAFSIPVGGVTAAIKSRRGFYVVKRLRDPEQGLAEVSAKHILVRFAGVRGADESVTRTKEQAQQLCLELIAKLKAGEDWDTLHAKFSEEGGAPGGDLGAFGRGKMVPAFERAAFGLDIGEISTPIESPFGYHVIIRYL